MLTDTHIHFDGLITADNPIDAIVDRAAAVGVDRMIAIGGSPAANRTALEIARAYPERIRAAVGYNRDRTTVADPLDELAALLASPEVAAIGEIGLDFHHGRDTAAAQIVLFRKMLALARERRLPVCVHTREAKPETLDALREHAAAWRGAPDRIGVMHCYTGDAEFAGNLLGLGFMIGFSGILTFKKAGDLRAVALGIPEDRLLIETDSPYLAPEPLRGQANEPANMRRVAEVMADLRRVSLETIAEITSRNAERLFRRSE